MIWSDRQRDPSLITSDKSVGWCRLYAIYIAVYIAGHCTELTSGVRWHWKERGSGVVVSVEPNRGQPRRDKARTQPGHRLRPGTFRYCWPGRSLAVWWCLDFRGSLFLLTVFRRLIKWVAAELAAVFAAEAFNWLPSPLWTSKAENSAVSWGEDKVLTHRYLQPNYGLTIRVQYNVIIYSITCNTILLIVQIRDKESPGRRKDVKHRLLHCSLSKSVKIFSDQYSHANLSNHKETNKESQ